MKALLISILLLGIQAQAQTKSPYETLREAFINASTPAAVEDFDDSKWQHCLFSDIRRPMMTQNTKVRLLELGSQGNGPLFPGGDYRIDVFNDYSINNNLPSFFQHSSVTQSSTDLRQTLDGPPWRHMNIFGRTDQDMLLFYVEVSDYYGPQAPMYPVVFGYCWNDASKGDGGNGGGQPLPIPPNPN